MDIICARCGRHLTSIEAAREHSRSCMETLRETNEWKPKTGTSLTIDSINPPRPPAPPVISHRSKPHRRSWGCSKGFIIAFMILVIGLVVLSQLDNKSELKNPSNETAQQNYTDQEVEEFTYMLINLEREKYGLNSTDKDELLISLARSHSTSMVKYNYFSHERSISEEEFGFRQPLGSLRGENIFQVPKRRTIPGPYLSLEKLGVWVVSEWMDSERHRENILNPIFTITGVGVARSNGYIYITQMFEGLYQN